MHYYQNSRNNHCKQAILTIFQDFQAEIYLYFFLILQRNYDGILRLHDFFVAGGIWLSYYIMTTSTSQSPTDDNVLGIN